VYRIRIIRHKECVGHKECIGHKESMCNKERIVHKECIEHKVKVEVKQSHYRPEVPRGLQEVKVPRLHDNSTGW